MSIAARCNCGKIEYYCTGNCKNPFTNLKPPTMNNDNCKHYFIPQDSYWSKCSHCGMLAPIGQTASPSPIQEGEVREPLYRWVKASERQPPIGHYYFCRVDTNGDDITETIVEWAVHHNGNFPFMDWDLKNVQHFGGFKEDAKVIEWLEQLPATHPAPMPSVTRENVKTILQEALAMYWYQNLYVNAQDRESCRRQHNEWMNANIDKFVEDEYLATLQDAPDVIVTDGDKTIHFEESKGKQVEGYSYLTAPGDDEAIIRIAFELGVPSNKVDYFVQGFKASYFDLLKLRTFLNELPKPNNGDTRLLMLIFKGKVTQLLEEKSAV